MPQNSDGSPASRQLFTGALYLLAAALGAVTAFTSTMLGVNGAPFSAWIPIAASAAVLLFVDGISLCLPAIPPPWRIALAAITPIAACSLFLHWPLSLWIAAAALAILEAGFLILAAHTHMVGAAAFAASIVLALAAGTGFTQQVSYYLDLYQTVGSSVTTTQIASALLPSFFAILIFFITLVRSSQALFPTHR